MSVPFPARNAKKVHAMQIRYILVVQYTVRETVKHMT